VEKIEAITKKFREREDGKVRDDEEGYHDRSLYILETCWKTMKDV